MSPRRRARPVSRTRSAVLAALIVTTVTVVGVVGHRSPSSQASTAPPRSTTTKAAAASSSAAIPMAPAKPPPSSTTSRPAGIGRADGVVPDGVTVFDRDVPAVANLDPALRDALRRAAADADVTFSVNSGWRSRAYQEQLLRQAVSKYGSERAAARWVATPDTSPHVSGDAIDLGSAASTWLARHGARYGLCQIYGNEPWHFELRPSAVRRGCPEPFADPTHDPRMDTT